MRLSQTCLVVGFLVAPLASWAQLCGQTCAGSGGFQYQSPTGDYVGQGKTQAYAAPPHLLQAVRNTNDKSIQIRLNMPQEPGTTGDYWTIDFATADKTELKAGTYSAATRYPFMDAGTAGLWWAGLGRGCNRISGSFTVHEVTFKTDGSVQSFAADFRQSCETTMPAAIGQVRFNSSVPFTTTPTTPGTIVDSDGDGIPDSVEASEGKNPFLKDNDIFTNSRLFAMQQYRDFYGREGDAAGITYWSGQISSGAMTRAQMAEIFTKTGEFATSSGVARLYFAYFLRVPDAEGLNFWVNYAAAGNSLLKIADLFTLSDEFGRRYGGLSNTQFVTLVYKNVLAREPDAAGRDYWMNLLNNNKVTWGQVMLAFSESVENQALTNNDAIVTLVFTRLLRRTPDTFGYNYWTTFLDFGNPVLPFIAQVMDSPEYRARFLP